MQDLVESDYKATANWGPIETVEALVATHELGHLIPGNAAESQPPAGNPGERILTDVMMAPVPEPNKQAYFKISRLLMLIGDPGYSTWATYDCNGQSNCCFWSQWWR